MKRRLLTTLTLLLGLASANPQRVNAQGFEFGLRDGFAISSLVGIDNTLPQLSFYAGVVGNYFFDENWGLGLDLTLCEQGALCKENGDGVMMEYSYHYLNIPLLGQYQVALGGDQSLRLMAGVQIGVFLVASYDYSAPSIMGEGLVSGTDLFDRSDFHPVDVGLSLGAQWLVGKSTAIEARYTLGITQTHNGISNTLNGYYYISVPDNRNSVFQIGTTVLF